MSSLIQDSMGDNEGDGGGGVRIIHTCCITLKLVGSIHRQRVAALNIKAVAVEFEILPNFKAQGK